MERRQFLRGFAFRHQFSHCSLEIQFDFNKAVFYNKHLSRHSNGLTASFRRSANAGKPTAVKLLSERFNMVFCGESYQTGDDSFPWDLLPPEKHPFLCYFDTMSGWREFINRTHEQYWQWIRGSG
jgi:hypothetical protein